MTDAARPLSIDFVSDVVCPWCVVGLGGLEAALATLQAEGITAEVTFRPFELNPDFAQSKSGAFRLREMRGARTSGSTSPASTAPRRSSRPPTGP